MRNIKAVMALLFVACTVHPVQRPERVLQTVLDSAIADDELIILTRDTDFSAPPGTVIFISREKGTERMVALARTNEPELGMLFLPEWKAWIVESKVRMPDESRMDIRYISAALAAGMEVEHWHTHNNVGARLSSDEEMRKRSIQWTMPSPDDLRQLYEFARYIPGGKLRGVIASIYGVTTYWNDDPSWADPTYVGYAVRNEGHQLHQKSGKITLAGLPEFAVSHQGFVKLRFEPVILNQDSKSPEYQAR